MKIILLVMLATGLSLTSFSQSVGINTSGAAPLDIKAMLEVRKPGYSKIKVRTENYLDTAVLELSNRTTGNAGTDMLFSLISEQGLLISSASDLGGNTKDSLLALRIGSGFLGLGIKNPANAFHLNTPLSTTSAITLTNSTTGTLGSDGLLIGINGSNATIANLESGSLRLGTSNLTRLAIDAAGNVGIGTLAPVYKLDINGDMNFSGMLRVDGSAGLSGQVLVSNGTGSSPSWRETSFANNTRFGVHMTNNEIGGGTLNILTTEYNLNTADIVIGASSITINKTGLYHFNGEYSAFASSTTSIPESPEFSIGLTFTGGFNYSHSLERWNPVPARTVNNTYFMRRQFSQDFYITAPTTLTVGAGYGYSGSPLFTDSAMNLFAYRISD